MTGAPVDREREKALEAAGRKVYALLDGIDQGPRRTCCADETWRIDWTPAAIEAFADLAAALALPRASEPIGEPEEEEQPDCIHCDGRGGTASMLNPEPERCPACFGTGKQPPDQPSVESQPEPHEFVMRDGPSFACAVCSLPPMAHLTNLPKPAAPPSEPESQREQAPVGADHGHPTWEFSPSCGKCLPLGHEFVPCHRQAERCEGEDKCHRLLCGRPAAAHVAPSQRSGR